MKLKGESSGGFTSDAILHAPDILFDLVAAVLRSFLTDDSITPYLLACCFIPLIKGSKDYADTG